MSAKKSNGITVANLISCLGFILFAIMSFLGLYMLQNADLFYTILLTALNLGVVLGLLFLMVHAKTKPKKNSKRWFLLEMTCFVFYLLFVIFWASKPVMHFSSVLTNREAINNDYKEIINHFTEYETTEAQLNEKMLLSRTILNHKLNADIDDDKISKVFPNGIENLDNQKIDTAFIKYNILLKEELFGSNYESFKNNALNTLDSIQNSFYISNYFNIIDVSKKIDELDKSVVAKLNEFSENASRFELEINSNGKIKTRELKAIYSPSENLIFSKTIVEENGNKSSFSTLGLFLIVFSQICLFVTYLFARRSLAVPIGKNRINDGGIALFD